MQTIERFPRARNESAAVIVAVVISGCASTRVSLGYAIYRVEAVKGEELHVGRLAHSAITLIDSSVTAVVLANGVEAQEPGDLIPVGRLTPPCSERPEPRAEARPHPPPD